MRAKRDLPCPARSPRLCPVPTLAGPARPTLACRPPSCRHLGNLWLLWHITATRAADATVGSFATVQGAEQVHAVQRSGAHECTVEWDMLSSILGQPTNPLAPPRARRTRHFRRYATRSPSEALAWPSPYGWPLPYAEESARQMFIPFQNGWTLARLASTFAPHLRFYDKTPSQVKAFPHRLTLLFRQKPAGRKMLSRCRRMQSLLQGGFCMMSLRLRGEAGRKEEKKYRLGAGMTLWRALAADTAVIALH